MAPLMSLIMDRTSFLGPSFIQAPFELRRAWTFLIEAKANALHFMKILWQFIWEKKTNLDADSPFMMAGQLFAPFILDTL